MILSPFWGTGEFALAIFANFIGPRQGDIEILKQFAQVADFKQLLIRAAIRMLLVMQYLQQVDAKLCQIELQAAELVIDFVSH